MQIEVPADRDPIPNAPELEGKLGALFAISLVIENLTELVRKESTYPYTGICAPFLEYLLDQPGKNGRVARSSHWEVEAFKLWPEFSGVNNYPVPSYHPALDCSQVYARGPGTKINMWSPDLPYGQARRRLLAFMQDLVRQDIKMIRERIKSQKTSTTNKE